MKKIAIIGAGLSGVTLGSKLCHKADVTIFEKGRGVGGRMSTRYADPFVFDHGAPYFTVTTQALQNLLTPLYGSVVAKWGGELLTVVKDNFTIKNSTTSALASVVAIPNMNSLCKHLALGLNIKIQCEVRGIQSAHNKWRLIGGDAANLGVYDMVIATAPAAQTLQLFRQYVPKQHAIFRAQFDSVFAMILGMQQPWDKTWIAAQLDHGPIKSISIDSTKPGRNNNVSCLVIHSATQWANANVHRDITEVQEILLQALTAVLDLDSNNFAYVATHRWLC